jgi:hypothetical protein
VDPADRGDQGVPAGRDDRDPLRPGADERDRRRLHRLLRDGQVLKRAESGRHGHPGPGGGRTGALVLSKFAARSAVDKTPSDHYTLLRTIEDLVNLPYLGYAIQRKPFGKTVFPSESGGGGSTGN